MTDRDRLIELLENCIEENVGVNDPNVSFEVDYENIADHLLANGVFLLPEDLRGTEDFSISAFIEAMRMYKEKDQYIKSPCKVGNTVYCIVFLPIGCYWCVQKGFVREIRITEENVSVNIVDCENTKYANLNIIVPIADFGKTVFLTKEEAEQKLKELK